MIKSIAIPALLVLMATGLMQTSANASEPTPPAPEKSSERPQADCSQQVWPHISAACLRNGDSKIEVRLVTATRR
jgi:hypothetical protein